MKELTKEDLRNIVREIIIGNDNLKEYGIIAKDAGDWEAIKDSIKYSLVSILKDIEEDEYHDPTKKKLIISRIDILISNLKSWKNKLEKHL